MAIDLSAQDNPSLPSPGKSASTRFAAPPAPRVGPFDRTAAIREEENRRRVLLAPVTNVPRSCFAYRVAGAQVRVEAADRIIRGNRELSFVPFSFFTSRRRGRARGGSDGKSIYGGRSCGGMQDWIFLFTGARLLWIGLACTDLFDGILVVTAIVS